jgi:glucosamine-6-phosphate deaminase
METGFNYSPSKWVPFRDQAVLERVRRIKTEELTQHPNPKFKIRIVKDDEADFIFVTDMFYRIKKAADADEKIILILPNPVPSYRKVAYLINLFKVNCNNLYTFAMDEYADENGHLAPETWRQGFTYAMMNNFYYQIDEKLRPPKSQFQAPNNKNIHDYGKMIADMGGADMCYSGPGWTGHLAFIEPDAPEFDAPLEEWKKMGPRIVTLSPFTLAQNSLHGSFGMSGDLAMVPPKAATIGPAEVIASKARLEMHALSVHNTTTAWQRMISRLVLHGPVTPLLPSSIHQLLETDCIVSETIAANIEPNWDKGY